jgi:general secretion pathway protein G
MRAQEGGFTLIELLVVLVILGLLAALVGPNIIGQGERARPKVARTQIENLGIALDMFRLDVGRYPTEGEGLEALRSSPSGLAKWDGPYLRKVVPKDPWDRSYAYSSSRNNYEVTSYGADGVPGGDRLDADIKSSAG